MKKRLRIAVAGDLLYDCFAWADRLPRMGETVTGYQNGFFQGGKGGNQAIAAARLGAEVWMLGKVGRDERGDFLLSELDKNGVHTEDVIISDQVSTGTCCVQVDSQGHNFIIVVPLANEQITDAEGHDFEARITQSDAVLCQLQLRPETALQVLRAARKAGCLAVLNPAPAKALPEDAFAMADYVTPNETEAEFYTGLSRESLPLAEWCEEASRRLLRMGARRVLLTLGEHGAYYKDGRECFLTPAFSVDAVDSTAAGDAFNAAFILRIAMGDAVRDAVVYANAAGALTASKRGSQPSLPTAKCVAEFLRTRVITSIKEGEICISADIWITRY
ncbi:MAG: ribokinase [Clostridia bacterium]|nr:ribokinase [Clostridia bacterium]